ncbi:MAG: hypothetical protein ACI3U1_09190, partial [Peptococcaceae bacterium]
YEKETNLLTKLIRPYGKPNIALRVDNTESMRRIIARSPYVAFFPYFSVKNDAYVESGLIRPLPVHDADLKLYITYIESPNFKDRQGNQIFFNLLKKIIADNQYDAFA